MDRLTALKKYFTTGTAEAEGNILDDAFVPMEDFAAIITPPHASPRLLIGKKGSGKSAFVRDVRKRLAGARVPLLILKPKDIQCKWPEDPASLGDLTRHSERAILEAIGSIIGAQLHGFISPEQNQLATLAQNSGLKDRDFVQKALDILRPIGQAITDVDFEKLSKGLPVTPEKLRNLVESQLSSSSQLLYLVIDDTDQVASPAEPNQLNRIWSILLATRFILEECPHIRAIVTLRTEVWKRLCRDDAGQRDQVDHFRNLIHWLNPNDKDISAILDRRLDLAKRDLRLTLTLDHYSPFFDDARVLIPTTHSEFRSWSDFVVKRSRERPRDGVQFVSALLDAAIADGRDSVTSDDVAAAIVAYSGERVEDLEREVGDECRQIRQILRSFAFVAYDEQGFKLRAETLYRHLAGVPSRSGVTLMGQVLQPGRDETNAFLLWRYLHEVGFITARDLDSTMPKGFRHILMKDDASLVSRERWNQVQTLLWEVHPAYRDYLIAVQAEVRQAKEMRQEIRRDGLTNSTRPKRPRR